MGKLTAERLAFLRERMAGLHSLPPVACRELFDHIEALTGECDAAEKRAEVAAQAEAWARGRLDITEIERDAARAEVERLKAVIEEMRIEAHQARAEAAWEKMKP